MTSPDTQRARPGGRSARVRQAALDAAAQQLLERGWEQFTVRDVAKAAGVGEATIYRHWPTRGDLASEALAAFTSAENPVPDTGELERDLRTLMAQLLDFLRGGELQRLVRAAAALDAADEASPAAITFWRARFAGAAQIATRAIERGELPPTTDPDALIEFLVAPAYLRLLFTGLPLDDALLESSVTRTLAAFSTREA